MQRLTRLNRLRPSGRLPLYRPVRQVAPIHHLHNHHTVHVQRVRFQQPKPSYNKRLMKFSFIVFGMYFGTVLLLELLDLTVEVPEEDEEGEEGFEGEEGEKGHADATKPHGSGEGDPLPRGDAAETFELFIPFPFTETEVLSPFYEPDSPEMEEFNKIWRDPRQVQKMKHILASDLASLLQSREELTRRWGPVVGWTSIFDVRYPKRPPSTWEQSGILIRSSGRVTSIALGRVENVDAGRMRTLHKILWPVPVAKGLWNFTKEAASHAYASFFGGGPAPRPTVMTRAATPTFPPSAAGSGAALPPFVSGRQTTTRTSSAAENSSRQQQQQQKQGSIKPPGGNDAVDMRRLVRVPPDMLRELAPEPWNRLLLALEVAWHRKWDRSPPRGCVLVYGRMQVRLKHASFTMNVAAYWDPKVQKYHGPSLVCDIVDAIRVNNFPTTFQPGKE